MIHLLCDHNAKTCKICIGNTIKKPVDNKPSKIGAKLTSFGSILKNRSSSFKEKLPTLPSLDKFRKVEVT